MLEVDETCDVAAKHLVDGLGRQFEGQPIAAVLADQLRPHNLIARQVLLAEQRLRLRHAKAAELERPHRLA